MTSTKFNVITLNCWGLKLPKPFCELRKERLRAIGEYLSQCNYDLVLLQEVWVQEDFDNLCKVLFKALPHSHYFHSGIFGSGLCVFSKHSILETFQHQFRLKGSAFRFYHGDWYASKSVGLVQLLVNGLQINAYVTHTHPGYRGEFVRYNEYRITQAFEMSQFIKLTSDGCDAVILGGDFNFRTSEFGYNLVVSNANLMDCWIEQMAEREDDAGATANHPENNFSCHRETPPGRRIDYLFYRANSGCDVRCESCKVTMRKIPNEEYCYSDHFAVSATLTIKKNITGMAPEVRISAVKELYTSAIPQLEDGIARYHNDRLHYGLLALVSLLALTFLCNLQLSIAVLDYPMGLIRTMLILTLALCLWCAIVVTNTKENIMTSVKKDMENQLRILQEAT